MLPFRAGVVVVVIALAMGLVGFRAPHAGAGEPPGVAYQPPVDAPVVDPFRAPPNPYGVGNRGLTYDLAPQTPVTAAAEGTVVFAGPVAGTLHVTVLHADGRRTSYSYLSSVAVGRGHAVTAGEVVGSAGPGFHFGVRDGDAYIDPAGLFGTVRVHVRLIAHDEPLPRSDAGAARERAAAAELIGEQSRLRRLTKWALDRVDRGIEVGRNGAELVDQLAPGRLSGRIASDLYDRWHRACTKAATRVTAGGGTGRTAVLVAGYGSNSASASIDDVATEALGYGDSVMRFSYAGGRVPGAADAVFDDITTSPYAAADTYEDLRAAGVRLADLIVATAAAAPDRPVDVYAHSQGGIVTRLALAELQRRPGGLDRLGVVVTIGTPHAGADLATVAQVLSAPVHDVINGTVGRVADLNSEATSVRQMAAGSDVIRTLEAEGVPDGVDFRTVGARGDLVVTGEATTVAGQPSAMVDLTGPSAHDRLPGAAATTRELNLALAGLPPSCRSITDTALDATLPQAISWAESGVGTVLASL